MKTIQMLSVASIAALMAAVGAARSAVADSVTINLNTITTGSIPAGDNPSSPYLSAQITDGTNGGKSGVYMTLSALGIGTKADPEHVLQWDFNVSTVSNLSFAVTSQTGGTFTAPTTYVANVTDDTKEQGFIISSPVNTYDYDANKGTTYYNLEFYFVEDDKDSGTVEFVDGEGVTYFVQGLSVSSFLPGMNSTGGKSPVYTPDTYYSSAFIDDCNNAVVAGVEGTSGAGQSVPLPLASFGGLALLGALGVGGKLRRKLGVR